MASPRRVPAISLAWWRVISTAACCGALLTRVERVSVELQCELDELPLSHLPTHTPRLPPLQNAYNPTSTPYSITPHSTSSSASVHNKSAPGPTPVRPLYAGESTDEEQCVSSPVLSNLSICITLSGFDVTNYFCSFARLSL
ncbi:hypothetical protein B0H14DRAFT_2749387, partial [Mycena olivaceomarginata]